MRVFVLMASVAAMAFEAQAQAAALDGKAQLTGSAGAYFASGDITQPIEKSQMRDAIVALMADGKINASERDLLDEIAAQSPFTLTISGPPGQVNIPPASDGAVALARLMMNPPNMHSLWHADAERTEQLVEISRWGPAAQSRVTAFFGNQLYDAWGQSNLINAFSPFVDALGREWNAVKALSDPASVREGKLLLIAGCEFTKQKVAAEGKDPPGDFLCAWMPGSL